MKKWVFLPMLAAGLAHAQTSSLDEGAPARMSAERQRLQAERSAIEQAHDRMQRDCWQRFAVNDCLREVRRRRFAALEPLRAQELELNAQERAWRTQQRDERLQEKGNAQESKP